MVVRIVIIVIVVQSDIHVEATSAPWTKFHPERGPQRNQPSCLARRTGNSSETGAGQKLDQIAP
jgi:hypothetical protein